MTTVEFAAPSATSMIAMLNNNPQWNAPVNIYAPSVATIDTFMSSDVFNSPITIETSSALSSMTFAFS
eukprot:scaffold307694_cov33-Tisochrysis_lutea.AAC.1